MTKFIETALVSWGDRGEFVARGGVTTWRGRGGDRRWSQRCVVGHRRVSVGKFGSSVDGSAVDFDAIGCCARLNACGATWRAGGVSIAIVDPLGCTIKDNYS